MPRLAPLFSGTLPCVSYGTFCGCSGEKALNMSLLLFSLKHFGEWFRGVRNVTEGTDVVVGLAEKDCRGFDLGNLWSSEFKNLGSKNLSLNTGFTLINYAT